MKRLRQSLFNAARHSGRRARLLVVAAVLGGAFLLIRPSLPTTVRVSYRLPEGIRSLEVDYEQGGQLVRAARFAWGEDGGPSVLRHEPELSVGATRIVTRWADRRGVRRSSQRVVEVSGDRVTRVSVGAAP